MNNIHYTYTIFNIINFKVITVKNYSIKNFYIINIINKYIYLSNFNHISLI